MADQLYPVSERSMRDYAKRILEPVSRGECVTAVWVPLAGRRRHSKFLLENVNQYDEWIKGDEYVLAYIDLIDLTSESPSGYLELILRTLVSQLRVKPSLRSLANKYEKIIVSQANKEYTFWLSSLKKLIGEISKKNIKTVLFLAEIDDLEWLDAFVFGNLKSLREEYSKDLQYVFLIQYDLDGGGVKSNWRHVHNLIIQNIVNIPLLDEADVTYMIWRLSKEFDYDFSDLETELITEFGGNHPYLLKTSAKIVKDIKEKKTRTNLELALTSSYPLQSIATGISKVVSQESVTVLRKIARRNKLTKREIHTIRNLIDRKVVVYNKNGYRLFSKTFENYVRNMPSPTKEIDSTSMQINIKTGQLFFEGKSFEERFTNQEYSVLKLMIGSYDRIVSRDQIGDVMWGSQASDKYSDWAIDQLISKTRRKLTSIGVRNKLITVRGSGYKLKH